MESNRNHQLNIRDVIFSFLPMIMAICLQYIVIIGDIIVLFIYNLMSDEKTISTRSPGAIFTAQYNQPMNLAYITLLQYVLYVVVFGFWYYRIFKKHAKADEATNIRTALKNSFINMFNRYTALFMIGAGVAAQFMVDGILTLIRPLLPNLFAEYDKMVSSVTGAASSWVLLLAVMFIAPIGEEYLFRGLILRYSKRCLPPILAIIFQAVLFGIYHGNIIQGVYAFVIGMVLGLVTYKFQSIFPAIILHMSINVSLLFVPGQLFSTTGRCVATTIVSALLFAGLIIASLKVATKSEEKIDKKVS